jgi:hypothetical protein
MLNHLLLYESYQSQRDLEEMVKTIFGIMASMAIERCERRNKNNREINHFDTILLKMVNPYGLDTLKGFMKDFGELGVYIITKEEFEQHSIGEAAYMREYNDDGSVSQRWVLLQEDDYTINRCNEYIREEWETSTPHEISLKIRDLLYRKYRKAALHELQHAYDDWRSGGKALNKPHAHKKNEPRYTELAKKDLSELKEEEREFHAKHFIEYLNLDHEVNARFIAAVEAIDFIVFDLDASFDQDRNVYVLRPFHEVVKSFKSKMYPFHVLTEEQKKKVLRKLGQFYEIERDFVAKKNEEENL